MTDKGVKKSVGIHTEDAESSEVGRFEGDEQHGWAPDVGEGSRQAKQAGERAFEARDTQAESRSEDGGTSRPMKAAGKVGRSINEQGNERAGRQEDKDSTGRERGKTSRSGSSTGVSPKHAGPIDPEMPDMGSGDQGG